MQDLVADLLRGRPSLCPSLQRVKRKQMRCVAAYHWVVRQARRTVLAAHVASATVHSETRPRRRRALGRTMDDRQPPITLPTRARQSMVQLTSNHCPSPLIASHHRRRCCYLHNSRSVCYAPEAGAILLRICSSGVLVMQWHGYAGTRRMPTHTNTTLSIKHVFTHKLSWAMHNAYRENIFFTCMLQASMAELYPSPQARY